MSTRRMAEAAIVFVVLSTLVTPFRRDLFVGDETKYGQVVREMRVTGAFFLPTLSGQPFTHKPPIHFWLIDLLTFPLGVYSTWAFVLPSIVAFVLLLWLLWRRGGPMAAFVCGTSLLVWASAQSARMDVSFTLLIAAGLLLLERFFDAGDSRALLGCGAALGVATLIKGPMAPVIGVVLFLLEWWRRRRAPSGNYISALAAMIVIPLAWFIPAMILGGRAYTREVIVKQTVGRAVASWVHKAPPWFYVEHFPATLFPWCFLGAVAVVALWRERRFLANWIIAVVVPYSLMSSKLDVYMMAMIPPLALLIAELTECGGQAAAFARAANALTMLLLAIAAVAGVFAKPLQQFPDVKGLLLATAVGGLIAFVIALRASLAASTIAAGIAALVPVLYVAIFLMPLANDLASSRPLVAALMRQNVAPENIALYACPYLWTRDMPRQLERVVYAEPETFRTMRPLVIATSRAHAGEIAPALARYHRVDAVRMIGKWFDVDRR
jgi:4-amino-4-deoxy-L-arabinose transferase-like glycosyltransferase